MCCEDFLQVKTSRSAVRKTWTKKMAENISHESGTLWCDGSKRWCPRIPKLRNNRCKKSNDVRWRLIHEHRNSLGCFSYFSYPFWCQETCKRNIFDISTREQNGWKRRGRIRKPHSFTLCDKKHGKLPWWRWCCDSQTRCRPFLATANSIHRLPAAKKHKKVSSARVEVTQTSIIGWVFTLASAELKFFARLSTLDSAIKYASIPQTWWEQNRAGAECFVSENKWKIFYESGLTILLQKFSSLIRFFSRFHFDLDGLKIRLKIEKSRLDMNLDVRLQVRQSFFIWQ